METYESGNMSMGSLMNYLTVLFGEENTVGHTPGGDCKIHLKVNSNEAKHKLSQTKIFESSTFEDIPNVNSVEYSEEEERVFLDVQN